MRCRTCRRYRHGGASPPRPRAPIPAPRRGPATASRARLCGRAPRLRARVYAAAAGVVPLHRACAEWEAAQLATFQNADGGYWFGTKAGDRLPFLNPVSTAFGTQALEMWHGDPVPRQFLI